VRGEQLLLEEGMGRSISIEVDSKGGSLAGSCQFISFLNGP